MREEGLVVVSLLKIYQKSELQFYKYRLMVGAEMHRPFFMSARNPGHRAHGVTDNPLPGGEKAVTLHQISREKLSRNCLCIKIMYYYGNQS